jgi:magnesium transporter
LLRLTPGALSSQRLVQRPGSWPSHLYVHGGLAPTAIELLVFDPEGVQRRVPLDAQEILALRQQDRPVWLRIRGLADRPGITSLLDQLGIPPPLIAPLIEVPQRPQVDCLDSVIMVVLHPSIQRYDHVISGIGETCCGGTHAYITAVEYLINFKPSKPL